MDQLFENPVPILAIGALAVVFAIVVFLSRRTGGALTGLVGALAATAALLVAERLVLTDREQVESALEGVMAAIETNDVGQLVGCIDPAAVEVVADARALGPIIDVERARATGGSVIDVDDATDPPTATTNFRAFLSGTLRDGGAPLGYFDDVEGRWVKRGERWLVEDYTAYYEGQPIDAVRSARGNRPVPGQ